MPTSCSAPGCERPVQAAGQCAGHYKQRQRGEELRPLRTARGEGTQISLRLSADLRRDIEKEAKAEGVEVPEWIRGAARLRLELCGKEFNSFGHICARARAHAGPCQPA